MKKTKVISFTSGKGGVGKSTLTCNLALRLAQNGKRVLILDGDLGMANIDVMFASNTKGDILDLLMGTKSISEIITEVSRDVHVLSGGSGLYQLNQINHFQRRQLMDSIQSISYGYDYMLIDTAPGISDNVLFLNAASNETAVIVSPDPSSITDAYALIKVMWQRHRKDHFNIICNLVKDDVDGLALYQRFSDVVSRFLHVGLDYWGAVPLDTQLRKANLNQRLILKHEPLAESAKAIRFICTQMEKRLVSVQSENAVLDFFEQATGVA